MLYFANPSTPKVRDAMLSGLLATIETPKQGNQPVAGATWCADNGCDVVGDAQATWTRSEPWLHRIRQLGYPAALVAQDGLEEMDIEWEAFDVLFIGGSTEWKLGAHARAIVAEAKRRGKRVHMGRVNSLSRLRYAQAIGCDSADGTYITFGPDVNMPKVLGWLRDVNRQHAFDLGALT